MLILSKLIIISYIYGVARKQCSAGFRNALVARFGWALRFDCRSVSADSITDKATVAGYYMLMIDLPTGQELLKSLGDNLVLPGMPVETFIRTDKRSAISFLLKPLSPRYLKNRRNGLNVFVSYRSCI